MTPCNDNQARRTFLVGASYSTRSLCDHECIFSVEIIDRTEHTVTVRRSHHNRVKRCKIALWDGVEVIKPWGSYSMCPVITAEKMAA